MDVANHKPYMLLISKKNDGIFTRKQLEEHYNNTICVEIDETLHYVVVEDAIEVIDTYCDWWEWVLSEIGGR